MGLAFLLGKLSASATLLLSAVARDRPQTNGNRVRSIDVGSILRAVSEAVLLLDERGRVLELNQAAENLVDHSRKEILGSAAVGLVAQLLGDRQEGAQFTLARALRGEHVQSRGKYIPVSGREAQLLTVSITPVCDTTGSVAGVLLAIKNLTEIAYLHSELEHGERDLAMGQMTAGLVHDFSNELSTISEAVFALEAGHPSSEHDRVVLGIIRNAIRRGADTLGTIRKYLAGKPTESSRVNVRQLLDEVLEIANPALNTHIGITVVRDTQSCGEVDANVDELRRAFTNLVLNALEAMPEQGTLTVSCRKMRDRVLVSVRDTGTGIPPEVQNRIFSAYFTTKAKGTGLGLAGARRAIEAQGGNIRFESVQGKGTTFYVTLPTGGAIGESENHADVAKHKVN